MVKFFLDITVTLLKLLKILRRFWVLRLGMSDITLLLGYFGVFCFYGFIFEELISGLTKSDLRTLKPIWRDWSSIFDRLGDMVGGFIGCSQFCC